LRIKLRMGSEDMDRTVSSNPFIHDQLKGLGVSASVWDDVLDEFFDEPFGNIPGPFRVAHRGWANPSPSGDKSVFSFAVVDAAFWQETSK
jgi:hypothetical protein